MGAIRANDFPPRRTDTDRRMAITPARGPIWTMLNGLTGIYGSDAQAMRPSWASGGGSADSRRVAERHTGTVQPIPPGTPRLGAVA